MSTLAKHGPVVVRDGMRQYTSNTAVEQGFNTMLVRAVGWSSSTAETVVKYSIVLCLLRGTGW